MSLIPDADDIANVLLAGMKYSLKGPKILRIVVGMSVGLMFAGLGLLLYSAFTTDVVVQRWGIAAVIGALAVIFMIGLYAEVKRLAEQETDKKKLEQQAREHPDEPKFAWDLARMSLEKYIGRNLGQIKSIFWLTLGMMIGGFLIIGYGIMQAYKGGEFLPASTLVTVSGIVVEFIAATFLVIYKSTIEQAKSYVAMLEKINAVGMGIQIMDGLPAGEAKDKLRSELALKLFSLYENQRIG